ncbi:MAG: tetratricopeptide repeat protein, partial [Candidatus Cloacimonadaceae bacterium]|nr:tetratricopeptide repeat protein [Candidatus Cloacimonadaceae bacterium]
DYKRYLNALYLKETGKRQAADDLFRDLVRDAEPEIRFLSYLERLKISFVTNPDLAIASLEEYILSGTTQNWRGEQYLQLGVFYFDRQDHASAIRNLVKARNFDLNPELLDRLEFLIPEAYYLLGEMRLSQDNFNRYLNLYSRGSYRDKALLRSGIIAFGDNDHKLAQAYFSQIMELYPGSDILPTVRFYQAEINFYNSNYNLALADYTLLEKDAGLGASARKRIAQCLFYLEDYPAALTVLESIPKAQWNYEMQVLLASVRFNQRNYEQALTGYNLAETMAPTPQTKTEARSYKAYTLYYLKRFDEASALFFDLSKQSASPDIYLYQAAKSAYQARNYKHALYLYDMLIDEYPNSP